MAPQPGLRGPRSAPGSAGPAESRRPPGSGSWAAWSVLALGCAGAVGGLGVAAPRAQRPALVIEAFTSARAYAVGTDAVTLVGTVRNVGDGLHPADAATGRVLPLAGLDFLEGDTLPRIPALGPGEAATFRWKLQPTSDSAPLIASFTVSQPGGRPLVRLTAVPHFPAPPERDPPVVSPAPSARAGDDRGTVENSRIRARVQVTPADVPVLLLSCRTPAGWRTAGASVPLVEVHSAEGGQRPWWETLKVREIQAAAARDYATLSLAGEVGLRWRCRVELVAQSASSALDCRLSLAAARQVRLMGLRFLPFLAGEGGPGPRPAQQSPPSSAPGLAAARWGDMTVGVLRPGEPPIPGWSVAALPGVPGADYLFLAAEARAAEPGTPVAAGAAISWRSRLVALSPSASVEDAGRLARTPPTPH